MSKAPTLAAVVDQFRAALRSAGLATDTEIVADGQLHRFRVDGDKARQLNGWYVLFADGVPAGEFGCWKRGIRETWRADIGRQMTDEEAAEQRRRLQTMKEAREQARANVRKACRKACRELWSKAREQVNADHAYLTAKRVRAYGLRQMGDALLVPVCDTTGRMHGLQFIQPDGGKRFKTGTAKAGAFHMIGIPGGAEALAIAEGYATAATIHQATGWAVAVAFDSGNLIRVAELLREAHPSTRLVLCSDDDRTSAGNPGRTAATEAASRVGGFLALPGFDDDQEGTDWNDWAALHGIEETGRALSKALADKPPPTIKPEAPAADAPPIDTHAPRFELRSDGVYWCDVTYSEGKPRQMPPLFLCSPLKILAASRDTQSREWGRLLEFTDLDGNRKLWAMPVRLLGGSRGDELRGELLAAGLPYIASEPKARNKLIEYLMRSVGRDRVRCVSRTGWHGNVFVMPAESFGDNDAERFYFQSESMDASAYETAGELDGWTAQVGTECGQHRRLVLAISAAFAGPLIALAGAESGGFHFVGGSSSGKTTALKLASSVWGNPASYWRQWRTTDNGLEAVAEDFTDSLMALDEIAQADAKSIGEMAYMLANGRGKQRAGRSGGARAVKSWRVMLLSTGEVGTATMLNDAGQKKRGGHDVRLVEVPADAGKGCGVFDSMGNHASTRELVAHLIGAAAANYGHAGPAFVRRLVDDPVQMGLQVRDGIADFSSHHVPANADGQVYRVAARFGLVMMAGRLATEFGLTGWHYDTAEQAAGDAFAMWLDRRGTAGAQEPAAMVAQIRSFLEAHGGARFQDLDSNEAHESKVIHRAGFRKMISCKSLYLILPGVFRDEVCAGYSHTDVARALDDAGHLVRQPGEGARLTLKVRVPALSGKTFEGTKPAPFYAVDAESLFSSEA